MPPLLIVRHGRPKQLRGEPPSAWPLAVEAMGDVLAFRDALAIGPDVGIAASDEPKALATAEALGGGRAVLALGAFREVAKPWFEDPAAHNAAARRYLGGERLEGWEPIADAIARFNSGVEHLGRSRPGLIVTHGTVMTAWLGSVVELPAPADFWTQLRMPDAYVVDVAAGAFERVALDTS